MFRIPNISGKYILGCLLALATLTIDSSAHAQGFKTLYFFCSQQFQQSCTDGSRPIAGLILDRAGNLYGTTLEGGRSNEKCPMGCGVIFKLAPDGTETVLRAFSRGSKGYYSEAGLIMDLEGNLYGTTMRGGTDRRGTVFRIAPDGTETVLYSFEGHRDGAYPATGLLADTAGNLYGTTSTGGGLSCFGSGCGIVFRLSPNGKESVVHRFNDRKDGAYPDGGLIADKSGNLYGTASRGGGTNTICAFGCGVVFKLSPDGTETVLHSFTSGSDGAYPNSALTMDASGNLYGTTPNGGGTGCPVNGVSAGCGTLFRVTPNGTETVLHIFCNKPCTEAKYGAQPIGGVVVDEFGNLYGTAEWGGRYDGGAVFKLGPDGTMSVLHSFEGTNDGAVPMGVLLQGSNGILYGTTFVGGAQSQNGTIFEIKE